jgi:solute carrier family 25 uncoupling protein 27
VVNAPFYAKALAGMTAGAIGQAIAVPCDLIKVRMQGDGRLVAMGKLDKPRYTGLIDAFTKIKAQEGYVGFYKGATPAIQRAALVNLGELTTYARAHGAPRGEGTGSRQGQQGACGGDTVASADACARPVLDAEEGGQAVRTHMAPRIDRRQEMHRRLHPRPRRSVLNSSSARTLRVPTSRRYDSAKTAIVENMGIGRDDLRCHLLSAFCSGFVASLCSTPADVAKSRIMNQKPGPNGEVMYKGTLHCWMLTVKQEGFLALYKGFLPGWFRLAPWQLVFWVTYERLRIVAGLGSFK